MTLWQLVFYFLKLGTVGFGGSVALAGYMQRDLVPRGWITEVEYEQGLAFSQIMPGPLAAQLAMWIGYIRYGVVGATLVGIFFILPSFLLVLVISALYVAYEGLPVVQAIFYGMSPCVIAIVLLTAYRLTRTVVGSDLRLWLIFSCLVLVTLFTHAEIALLFILAGLVGIFLHAPPRGLKMAPFPLLAVSGASTPLLASLFGFFLKVGALSFGSGLAIVPFLQQGVVHDNHWLSVRQFLDAVAVGFITPGPVVITAAFVGYLVAGFPGAVVSTLGIFLPIYLFVLCIGAFVTRYHGHPVLTGFVKGASSAATGAITGSTLLLTPGALLDLPTLLIFTVTLIALLRYKIPEPLLILAAGLTGIAIS